MYVDEMSSRKICFYPAVRFIVMFITACSLRSILLIFNEFEKRLGAGQRLCDNRDDERDEP